MEREVAWNHYSEEEKKKVFEFAEEYRKFISACKTEREIQWRDKSTCGIQW